MLKVTELVPKVEVSRRFILRDEQSDDSENDTIHFIGSDHCKVTHNLFLTMVRDGGPLFDTFFEIPVERSPLFLDYWSNDIERNSTPLFKNTPLTSRARFSVTVNS